MGYTHYWRRPGKIEQEVFNQISNDFKKLLPVLKKVGIQLGDGYGERVPEVNHNIVNFNGLVRCGHEINASVIIPWPAQGAIGIKEPDDKSTITGAWFAGVLLDKRTCNGDCSFESFVFGREMKLSDAMKPENGLYFECCKTAFRPYDLVVTAFLIIAKHYLKDSIDVSSDGKMENWIEGMMLCELELDYGMEFTLPT